MQQSCTLNEAWDYVYELYPNSSVYELYVAKKDWEQSILDIDCYIRISMDLIAIEHSFGIIAIREKIELLQQKLNHLSYVPKNCNIPVDMERETKLAIRETKKEIAELEEQLEDLLNTIEVDLNILHAKY